MCYIIYISPETFNQINNLYYKNVTRISITGDEFMNLIND